MQNTMAIYFINRIRDLKGEKALKIKPIQTEGNPKRWAGQKAEPTDHSTSK